MNRVVSFLPALTFPSQDGISPHGSVACAVSRVGLRAALAVPNAFMVKGLEKPPKPPWLSLTPPDSPQVTPPHGCDTALGISEHLPGQHMGLGKKRGFSPFSDTGDCFCTGLNRCASCDPGSGQQFPTSPLQLRTSLLSPAALIPADPMGCPPWDIPVSPSGRATSRGLRFLGVKPAFCVPSTLRFRNPGLPAQPSTGRVIVHFINYRIISKRKNTHKACPLDIRV